MIEGQSQTVQWVKLLCIMHCIMYCIVSCIMYCIVLCIVLCIILHYVLCIVLCIMYYVLQTWGQFHFVNSTSTQFHSIYQFQFQIYQFRFNSVYKFVHKNRQYIFGFDLLLFYSAIHVYNNTYCHLYCIHARIHTNNMFIMLWCVFICDCYTRPS